MFPRRPVRTEGRLALLESLMDRLWRPLWTRGRAKGHIYSWPVDVKKGAMEIIDFRFSPLLSVVLFIALLLRFPPFPQPGCYLGAKGDLLVSGAASIAKLVMKHRTMVFCLCVCVCAGRARLTPSVMVVMLGNAGCSLVRETFTCTSCVIMEISQYITTQPSPDPPDLHPRKNIKIGQKPFDGHWCSLITKCG